MTSHQRPRLRAGSVLRGVAAAFAGALALLLGVAAIRSEAQLHALGAREAARENVARIATRIAAQLTALYLQLGEATAEYGSAGLPLPAVVASLAERPYLLWRWDGQRLELATPGVSLVAPEQIMSHLAAGDGPLLGPLRSDGRDLIILQAPAAASDAGSRARLGWLIPLDDLWAQSGLTDFVSAGMSVSVTDTERAALLAPSTANLDDAVSASFNILGGRWQLEAAPQDGWPAMQASPVALFVVCLIGLGYGSACFFLSRRPGELERRLSALRSQIDERDAEVATLLQSRAQLETRLMSSLTVDLRTGLPNRSSFVQHLQAKLAEARLTASKGVSVAAVQFSKLEELGHSMGVPVADGFLVEAADRLQRLLGPETLLARTGDKELSLCLGDAAFPGPEAFVSRIFSVLEDRFSVGRQAIYSPALIGIAQSLNGYEHGPELVAQASLAATTSATSGNRWSVFVPEAREERINLLQLEADLQSAIHDNELMLNFQPIVSLQSGTVVGFESLLRWWHPTAESWIEPERFIPLAESLGLMSRISEWVAAQGVAHARRWRPLRQAPLYVTVNLTPRDLSRGFCNRIFDLLAANELAPECLRVEITETALVQDFGLAARLIGELNERGVRVLLDDFGTGYSSLSYLRDLPFHAVKIDKSFIQLMTSDARDFGLVRSIVSLVQYLGMECVAEGVETQEQLDLIGMVNCDFWQGFLFSPPVAATEVEALVNAQPATAAQAAG